jgi:hypothetical protein
LTTSRTMCEDVIVRLEHDNEAETIHPERTSIHG